MPQVRILSLGPSFAEKPPEKAVFLRFKFGFCSFNDCCFVAVQRVEKLWAYERG